MPVLVYRHILSDGFCGYWRISGAVKWDMCKNWIKERNFSMQTEMRFDFKDLWCYVICRILMKGEKRTSNHINRKNISFAVFKRIETQENAKSTEKKIDLLGVRLHIRAYSVCMVFFGYWRTSWVMKMGYVFFRDFINNTFHSVWVMSGENYLYGQKR